MLDMIRSYNYLISKINTTTKHLKAHRAIFDKEEYKYCYPVYEKAMYISIALTDLMVSLKYLHISSVSKNEYETNYFARSVAVTCYELINHQEKIVGKEIYKTVAKNVGSESLSEIIAAKKQLGKITKEHFQVLKNIRNNLYAHRHGNGYEMAIAMLNIENTMIYKIGKDIFDIYLILLNNYVQLATKLQ